MRYFVTGATGFIGGHVARMLARERHEVVALVRRPAAAQGLAHLNIRLHPGDITDINNMRGGMRGADGVFHIAAWYRVGVRDSAAAEGINVEGTRNVLRLIEELKVPRAVYTSTLAVFGDTRGRVVDETYRVGGPWLSEYDRTKWKAHYAVAEPMMRSGLPPRHCPAGSHVRARRHQHPPRDTGGIPSWEAAVATGTDRVLLGVR